MIIVEFDQKVTIEEAKLKLKTKLINRKAETDWPNLDNGSKVEPNVFEHQYFRRSSNFEHQFKRKLHDTTT